jgi:hypothetical protein
MSDVNLQLVREFFELHLFRVLTNWHQDPERRLRDLTSQLLVENVAPASDPRPSEFLLTAPDLPNIERALIEIRAWHADRFYPSVIESNPVLSQFVSHDELTLATDLFHGLPFQTILVVSELPASPEPRTRAADLLRARGIDHVIEFPAVLQGLLRKLDVEGLYGGSQTLQTLRLLKRYRFIRDQQMEFGFQLEPPPAVPPVPVEVNFGSTESAADEI